MAQIVGGLLLPHDPLISSEPQMAPPEKRDAVMSGFAAAAERLRQWQVDTVVVIGDDHYTVYGPQCLPRCLIGIGEIEGPVEPWLGIARGSVPNNEELASHIMHYGFEHGVDWAVAKTMLLDHSTMVPIELAVRPAGDLKVVPIYLNCAVEPLISSRRAYQIGRIVGDAIRSFEGSGRVAVIGTGGLSHWVGMARMGEVNESWDREVMDLVLAGDVEALMAMPDEEIIQTAGNGALEIKNWLCAMGAMGQAKAEVIGYTPVPEWICGCGFLELAVAA